MESNQDVLNRIYANFVGNAKSSFEQTEEDFVTLRTALASPPCVDVQPSTGADTVCVVEGFVGFYADEVNVHFVGYNSAQKLMRVEFKNGHQFNYQDVPKEIFDGMATSERRGKFLHEKVKGYYRYYRVNGD